MEKIITIKEDFIKLDSLLKYAGIAATGGHAKMLILDEEIKVNGEICTQRGKKIRKDDKVQIDDTILIIK